MFADFTDKAVAADMQVHVEHGKPLIFGKEGGKGLRVKPGALELEIVTIGEDGVTEDDILVHDETDRTLAGMLVRLHGPDFPTVIGVIYCDPEPAYDIELAAQVAESKESRSADMNDLLLAGGTWTVE